MLKSIHQKPVRKMISTRLINLIDEKRDGDILHVPFQTLKDAIGAMYSNDFPKWLRNYLLIPLHKKDGIQMYQINSRNLKTLRGEIMGTTINIELVKRVLKRNNEIKRGM